MSFDKSQLQTDFYDFFISLREKEDIDSDYLADGIAKITKEFFETGSVSTTDAGAISAGQFTGTGTGSLSISSYDTLKNALSAAFEYMKVYQATYTTFDTYLATQWGIGIKALSDTAIINTDVVGTCITPSGATVPMTGKAIGVIACENVSFTAGLVATFTKMLGYIQSKTLTGDADFAEDLANLTYSYIVAGVISTAGTINLFGSFGSGNIS